MAQAVSEAKLNYYIKLTHLASGRSALFETKPMLDKEFVEDIEEVLKEEVFPVLVWLHGTEIAGMNCRTKDRVLLTKSACEGCIIEMGVRGDERRDRA